MGTGRSGGRGEVVMRASLKVLLITASLVATSLGGVESTVERRGKLAGQEHVPPGLLRLSVGCEHIDDLWNDLNTVLGQAGHRQGHGKVVD
jgi:cystathionine beta-lyase/cystathionine gamma-synthase